MRLNLNVCSKEYSYWNVFRKIKYKLHGKRRKFIGEGLRICYRTEWRVKLTTSSYKRSPLRCISTVLLLVFEKQARSSGYLTAHRSSECSYVGVAFHGKCIRIAIPIPSTLRTSRLTALPQSQPLAKLIPASVSINSREVASRGCIPRHGRRQ